MKDIFIKLTGFNKLWQKSALYAMRILERNMENYREQLLKLKMKTIKTRLFTLVLSARNKKDG